LAAPEAALGRSVKVFRVLQRGHLIDMTMARPLASSLSQEAQRISGASGLDMIVKFQS